MTEDIVASRGDGLVEAEVDGEIVALHIDKGTCYGFNRTATMVWRLLEQPKSLGQLCEQLTADYEVEPERCRDEVLALLRDLESDGLVSLSEAA